MSLGLRLDRAVWVPVDPDLRLDSVFQKGPGLGPMFPVALGIRVRSGFPMGFLSMGSLSMGILLMEFLQSGIRWRSLLSGFDSFPFSES